MIFDEAGRVLLVKENYDRRRWSLPGGAREDGETLEQTAIRETLEETGLVVSVDHLIGTYGLKHWLTAVAFACTIETGTPAVQDDGEISEVRWWPADELPEPRSNILHYAVPDAVAGLRDVSRTDLPRVS